MDVADGDPAGAVGGPVRRGGGVVGVEGYPYVLGLGRAAEGEADAADRAGDRLGAGVAGLAGASLVTARQHATQQTPGQVPPLRHGQHRRARQRRGGDSVGGPRTEESGDFLIHDSFPFQRLTLSAATVKDSAKAGRPASGNFLKARPARILSRARRCLGRPVG